MGLASLVQTTFAAGPDDELAVADVYTKSDSNVINSIQELEDADGSGLGALALATVGVSKVPGVNYLSSDARYTSPDETLKRMAGEDNDLKSLFRNLTDPVKKAFTLNPTLKGVTSAVFNGNNARLLTRGLGDAKVIASMVNKFTGGSYKVNFKDLGSVSGLVSSLAIEGSRLGLPNTFSTMARTITDKSVLLSSARNIIPFATKSGDLNLFSDLSTTSIAKDITKINPNAISSMISGFKIKAETQANSLSSIYDSANTSFTNIDDKWKNYARGENNAMSGAQIAEAEDFKKLLAAKSNSIAITVPNTSLANPYMPVRRDDESFLMLMNKFQVSSVEKEFKKLFPTINMNVNPTVKDYVSNAKDAVGFNKPQGVTINGKVYT
jgi:hypothetical protein